jgi:hypothetical protein
VEFHSNEFFQKFHKHHDNNNNDLEPVQRLQAILECINMYWEKQRQRQRQPHDSTNDPRTNHDPWNDPHSPRFRAAMWFMNGAGREMEIPSACQDSDITMLEDDFWQLYGILAIRETLQIPDPSWYQHDPPIRNGIADICNANSKNNQQQQPPQSHPWARITCAASNHFHGDHQPPQLHAQSPKITKLSLNHANLTGTLPPEMSMLRHLTSLQVYSNPDVVGTIPESWSELSSLQVLALQQTSLAGTMPSPLARGWSHLQSLLLDGTHMTGTIPEEFCHLPKLETIHIPKTMACTCSQCQTILPKNNNIYLFTII